MHIKRLPLVSVERPCLVALDSMHGAATVRECAECNRYVHNLSAMTDADAENVVANRDWTDWNDQANVIEHRRVVGPYGRPVLDHTECMHPGERSA